MKITGSLRDRLYDSFIKEHHKQPLNEAELARWAAERGMLKPDAVKDEVNVTNPPPRRAGPTITWGDQGQMVAQPPEEIPE